jgi:predicted secreted Zn-dependent protease
MTSDDRSSAKIRKQVKHHIEEVEQQEEIKEFVFGTSEISQQLRRDDLQG